MKSLPAFVALCLLAVAAAPGGQAHTAPPPSVEKCVTVYDFPDAGYRLCYDLSDKECTLYAYRTTFLGTEKDCIYPDSEASAAAVGAPGFPTCLPVALGDLCFSPYWPGCNLWIEWTAIPHPPTCLYRSDGLAASAAGPGVQCMDVYSQTHLVGPYWLVRRDSCSAQVYECPDGHSPPAPPCQEVQLLSASAAAAAPSVGVPPVYCMPYEREVDLGDVQVVQGGCGSYVRVCDERVTLDWDGDVSCVTDDLVTMDCYAIYRRFEVGPAAIVMTSSCSGHAELCGDRVSPFAAPDLSCVVATTSASSEPQCLQVYREHDVGPVHYVSRDSCHSEVTVCDGDVKELPSADPVALADCAVYSWGLLA